MRSVCLSLVVSMSCVAGLSAQRGGGAPPGPANPFEKEPQAIEAGREIYNRRCTVCHGLDGGAGEMGPALGLEGRRYSAQSAGQIFDAIKNGIPATSMPPARDLPDEEIWKITAYLQALRGTAIDAPAPGNAARGEEIFWGAGQCGTCHMIRGKGGIIGPELTDLADRRKTATIVESLTNPLYRVPGDGGAIPRKIEPRVDYQPVRVTLADGRVIRGVLKNEDSISLQLLGIDDNRLHLLDRSRVKEVVYEKTSLMPRDYDKRLAAEDFRDLVAFLTRQSRR